MSITSDLRPSNPCRGCEDRERTITYLTTTLQWFKELGDKNAEMIAKLEGDVDYLSNELEEQAKPRQI